MRILHLANHARDVGNGIVNVMVDLAIAQAVAGNEVAIATEECEFDGLLAEHSVHHIHLPQRRVLTFPGAVRDLRRLAREMVPDIVHAHMVSGAVLGWISRWIGRTNFALVTTVHNEFQRSSDLMGLGDRVVAVSDALAASMALRGLPAHRMCVVRNGTIGSPRLARSAAEQLSLIGPAIVTVSGLYVRKGVLDLITAFAEVQRAFPAAQLYMVGDGPDREACVQLAKQLGVNTAVHFPGFVRDARPWMRAADIFVLASHSEGFPLVLVEAREAGCAIVATSVGGVPEVLEQGAAGQMVSAKQPRQLARAMIEMLGDSALLRQWRQRAVAGTEWLRVERVQHEYAAVYLELLAGKRQPPVAPTNQKIQDRGKKREQVRHG